MTLIELLDAAKERTGSDPKTAEQIGVDKGYLSRVRAGERNLNGKQAIALAGAAGITPEMALTIVMEARARSEEERSVWKRIRKALLIAGVGITLSGCGTTADAADLLSKGFSKSAPNIHYDHNQKRERARRRRLMAGLLAKMKSALTAVVGGFPRGFAPHPA